MRATLALVCALCGALFVGQAHAATRKVCARLQFIDNRSAADCATSSETGNRRGCSKGSNKDHVGALVELWDKDSDGTDERIGRFVYQFAGGSCFQFEWDNNTSANAEREANPDVYLVYVNEVWNKGVTRNVTAMRSDGSAHPTVSWRNGETGSPDRYTTVDCKTGTECWILPTGALLPSADINSTVAKRAMVLDSAQHTLEVFASIMTTTVRIRVPDTSGLCPTGCTDVASNIRLPDAAATSGIWVTHEMGHAVQVQAMRSTIWPTEDFSQSGAGWSLTSSEFDSAASQEGVATYAGVAAWYDGGVANTVPLLWGFNFEAAQPWASNCSGNRGLALQVAKSFWDMDDVTSEPVASPATRTDRDGWFPTTIMGGYSTFPAGMDNRQRNENDSNGLNVVDYFANTNTIFGGTGAQQDTLLFHNCINSQDPN